MRSTRLSRIPQLASQEPTETRNLQQMHHLPAPLVSTSFSFGK
ncbi:hypothetical protein HanXRQr2_Chr14g0662221 [Helianthus annuus]|uniref:Uncharacterized protein n=1 Tax=Helianthus annuus TaxID=4232 RepID=A0A9K3ECK6_HELAN|nr:hypothetical protein HanXRQr2_Chr14g0662221 [Helianthus annuus]KAJ0841886.1 hypothetical protein HanPSC8_Chr14g0635491 [Helianthus annuus]